MPDGLRGVSPPKVRCFTASWPDDEYAPQTLFLYSRKRRVCRLLPGTPTLWIRRFTVCEMRRKTAAHHGDSGNSTHVAARWLYAGALEFRRAAAISRSEWVYRQIVTRASEKDHDAASRAAAWANLVLATPRSTTHRTNELNQRDDAQKRYTGRPAGIPRSEQSVSWEGTPWQASVPSVSWPPSRRCP
jgi:hypothetical protein